MDKVTSIEKPVISEEALVMFKYLFYSRILFLDDQTHSVSTFAQQQKIHILQATMKRFIDSRPYSFFKIVVLPPKGTEVENAEYSLTVKNFDYFIRDMEPSNHVLVISTTWDSFKPYIESVDKNLIPIKI